MSNSLRVLLVSGVICLVTSFTAAAMFSTAAKSESAPLSVEVASEATPAPVFVSPVPAPIDLESCDSPAEL